MDTSRVVKTHLHDNPQINRSKERPQYLTMTEAVAELARFLPASQYNSRLDILADLERGQAICTNFYMYKKETAEPNTQIIFGSGIACRFCGRDVEPYEYQNWQVFHVEATDCPNGTTEPREWNTTKDNNF